jgi:hypothetical protein
MEGWPEKNEFLDVFYNEFMDKLLQPVFNSIGSSSGSTAAATAAAAVAVSGESKAAAAAGGISISAGAKAFPDQQQPQQQQQQSEVSASTIGLIVDLLCFCVQHHGYRAKYHVLRKNVVEKVLRLLGRREKWLVVAGVRFLRTCIGTKDDFYYR